MTNNWARIEELRLQEEHLFEYKLMQKNGTMDSYLEEFGKDAAKLAASVYRGLKKWLSQMKQDCLKIREEIVSVK